MTQKTDITILMPTFNSEKRIKGILESILDQDYANFKLIISDDASTDNTEIFCREYADKDSRITYFRQEKNLGVNLNFIFLLKLVETKYFVWMADDDFRTQDFLRSNYKFLELNPDYVASTSPNTYQNWPTERSKISFSLDSADSFLRYKKFFKNSFHCHAIFYSLIRTEVMKNCELLNADFIHWLAFDWAICLYLASRGRISRIEDGLITFGVSGFSSSVKIFKKFNTTKVEKYIPYYYFSSFVFRLVKPLSFSRKIYILLILIYLNILIKKQTTNLKTST